MSKRTQWITSLMMFSILFVAVAGCAPRSTQAVVPPTASPAALPASSPTPPPGWKTYSASTDQGQCSYVINHPSDMEVVNQGAYSRSLSHTATEPSGPVPNFVYVSLIPDGFSQSDDEPGIIYNYVPAETEALLNMQVGEGKALRDDPNMADWFSYTRLPDKILSSQTAQAYENTQPWEFPTGTKETRYYLKGNGCTYLIGGYMATVGSGQPGAIDAELFDQIIATFRLAP